MANARAFTRQTLTHLISVGATASAAEQIAGTGNNNVSTYVVSNRGATYIYFSLSSDGALVPVIPTAGTAQDVTPLAGGQSVCVTGPSNAFFSAIGAVAGPVSVLVFGGDGLFNAATGNS